MSSFGCAHGARGPCMHVHAPSILSMQLQLLPLAMHAKQPSNP